jgi:hypothetical protein
MKNLVMFVAVIVIGFFVWKHHSEKKAAEVAAAAAAARPKAPAAPGAGQAVAISAILEPWAAKLWSKLETSKAEDLVPPFTVARERLIAAKARVEPAKQPIYEQAIVTLGTMIKAGEERTKVLETQLQASKNAKSSLDSKNTAVGSKEFFAKASQRRWEGALNQFKPQIAQGIAALRAAEEAWNAKLPPTAPVDSYDIDRLDKVFITIDAKAVSSSSLDRAKYNETRTLYPWRSAYYQKYGVAPVR